MKLEMTKVDLIYITEWLADHPNPKVNMFEPQFAGDEDASYARLLFSCANPKQDEDMLCFAFKIVEEETKPASGAV